MPRPQSHILKLKEVDPTVGVRDHTLCAQLIAFAESSDSAVKPKVQEKTAHLPPKIQCDDNG